MLARSLPSTRYRRIQVALSNRSRKLLDFDSVQQLTLADIRINGQTRKVIMQATKSGFFLVSTGSRGNHSGEPFAQVNWAGGYDLKTGRPKLIPTRSTKRGSRRSVAPSAGGATMGADGIQSNHEPLYIPIYRVRRLCRIGSPIASPTTLRAEHGVDFGVRWRWWSRDVEVQQPDAVAHPPEHCRPGRCHRRRTDHSTTTPAPAAGAASAVGAGPVLPMTVPGIKTGTSYRPVAHRH